ncbi:trypsin alpha-like [Thrips palmi]|uniref:Trypsin alpha-like n=1 Tax=Thrips palmi TaxID=161013 RepID=A0A6P8XYM3_THRPL|nr:trypsin alpha-like [Thrips palmi]
MAPSAHSVAALALLALALLVGLAEKSQAVPEDSSIAYPGQFPWHAAVFQASPSTLLGSGILVGSQYVLTAASTVTDKSAADVRVLLGELTTAKGGNVAVSAIKPHESWSADSDENDIALLVLAGPVLASVTPVRLPARYYQGATYVDQTLSVTGWGTDDAGNTETYLSVSNLNVIRNRECQTLQNQNARLPWTKMCAVGTGPTPCKGDSGDPVVFLENDSKYTLVGILTKDTQCSTKRPSTITRITEFLDWISTASDGHIVIQN